MSGIMRGLAHAVSAGPVAARRAAVTIGVLRKPVVEMGARSYRVTVPWKDPKVELMGREAPEAPAQPQAAPPQPEDPERDAEVPAPVPAGGDLPNPAAAPHSSPRRRIPTHPHRSSTHVPRQTPRQPSRARGGQN